METPAATESGLGTAVSAGPITHYRWVICALLFLGTTVNYVDRQVIGLLKPILEQQFKWTESDYANIVFSFQLAYALGLLVMGAILDRVGVRLGYALAVVFWRDRKSTRLNSSHSQISYAV